MSTKPPSCVGMAQRDSEVGSGEIAAAEAGIRGKEQGTVRDDDGAVMTGPIACERTTETGAELATALQRQRLAVQGSMRTLGPGLRVWVVASLHP